MPFLASRPLSAAARDKIDRSSLTAAIAARVTEATARTPLRRMDAASDAVAEFEQAYLDYRLDGVGTPEQLDRLVEQIKADLGARQGDEAVRVVGRAVDDSIAAAVSGPGCSP